MSSIVNRADNDIKKCELCTTEPPTLGHLTAAFHDAHCTVAKNGRLSAAGHKILDPGEKLVAAAAVVR